ncbi:MAG: hypothetical protein R3D62_17655 [Xanthobacteraceae bacterium]
MTAEAPFPAGFDPARAEARVGGVTNFFSVFFAFLPAGFVPTGFAAAVPFRAGFAAAVPFRAGFAAATFFNGFFGAVAFAGLFGAVVFAGFFAAAVFFAAARPVREDVAAVRRDTTLPFFAGETALPLRLLVPDFFFVTLFDFPAMVFLSLRFAGGPEQILIGLARFCSSRPRVVPFSAACRLPARIKRHQCSA